MRSNAEKHAKIAKAVWPDALIFLRQVGDDDFTLQLPEKPYVWIDDVSSEFNLLATNPDGTPTTQAKADALDTEEVLGLCVCVDGGFYTVYQWGEDQELVLVYSSDGQKMKRPEAIFNAAWEVVK